MHHCTRIVLALFSSAAVAMPALATDFCATPEQAKRVAAFYAASPGTMPPTAAARLRLLRSKPAPCAPM